MFEAGLVYQWWHVEYVKLNFGLVYEMKKKCFKEEQGEQTFVNELRERER